MTDDDKKTLEFMRIGCAQGWKVSLRTTRDATALIERQAAEIERLTLRWSKPSPVVTKGIYLGRWLHDLDLVFPLAFKEDFDWGGVANGFRFLADEIAGPIATPMEPT